ncbi:hypothetical protein DMA12_10380 [Amycolatopsis balhimycina DSM 5908]|uniref:Guanylate cyclase domain-containing protein n=1 Tax=Amycolatopsis balhimycina DSM 5908 TaxID=1081091 RepID=A0A428WU84_AMYBA|nr:hypothetical protein [Amycolatopsis balhimycina]RSM46643.1 hypothetical protein DMA12_10380 [Amycolatopsis balhimycina DSM 5908]
MDDRILTELPAYRAVLAVDTQGFGNNSDLGQALLSGDILEVLAVAFTRAGLAHVWRNALFPHTTGDGVCIGFEPRHLPAVVTRFFDTLQDVLADRELRRRTPGRHARLRMRAGLHVGPVLAADPQRGSAAAIGSAVVATHRILDAPAVRTLLDRSDPEQTFLSVAFSERVFDDVVATGYARLPSSSLVPSRVRIKEYAASVYLYVPRPSGDLLRHGFGAVHEAGHRK